MRRFYCDFCLETTFLLPDRKTLLNSLCFLFFSLQSFAGPSSFPFAAANSSNYDLVYYRISITANPADSTVISAGNVTAYFIAAVSNLHADGSCMFYT